MNEAPGWYVDPDESTKERYWNGSMWGPSRNRRRMTPHSEGVPDLADEGPDRDSAAYTNELLEAVLLEQRRSANYLAVLTYITVVLLVLGVAGVVVGVLAAKS